MVTGKEEFIITNHESRITNHGVYLIDKPRGWTSCQVVREFRKRLPQGTRVGHCGTLDPLATGLLILLVGPATKLQKEFQQLPKTYAGWILLGIETDTGDMDGRVLNRSSVPEISLLQLKDILSKFNKTLEIYPPDYSAVKYKGKPLYYYARKGLPMQKPLKKMAIYRWEAREVCLPRFSFELDCGSGTYVRSLAELLGKKLGCGAAVENLRRTRIGPYRLEDACPTTSPSARSTASTEATRN